MRSDVVIRMGDDRDRNSRKYSILALDQSPDPDFIFVAPFASYF